MEKAVEDSAALFTEIRTIFDDLFFILYLNDCLDNIGFLFFYVNFCESKMING